MKDGFLRVCAASPEIRVADVEYNKLEIIRELKRAARNMAKLIVFPELCLTGYTASDLFLQSVLLDAAKEALGDIIVTSEDVDAIVAVGLPLEISGRLYNVAAVVSHGELLALIPKSHIPNYSEFYEARHFAAAPEKNETVQVRIGQTTFQVPFGRNILFQAATMPEFVLAAEICEDLWVPNPPSISHAMAGATVIMNLSASNELTGKRTYRRDLVSGQSARLMCAYVYASAGAGESTQDLVFSGHNIISENGILLSEADPFTSEMTYADLDLQKIRGLRRLTGTFDLSLKNREDYTVVPFEIELDDLSLSRYFARMPFVPGDEQEREERCEEILSIQSMGLKKRLQHTGARDAVIGLSGGLDSTLALLVTVRAFDSLNLPRSGIHTITMPCFGTTDRTYGNALLLAETLGTSLREIDIRDAVLTHFRDLEYDSRKLDVTYENSQARERTQILMDYANKVNGLVIGTGDLSELVLGWATYNGDHMSMYGVNCSIPKTLVRHLVRYTADTTTDERLQEVLLDILDTPVSPELLPPKDGQIAQKTEDLVGPYELHDFFLYHMFRFGYHPAKIYRMAKYAWGSEYDDETILKWLKTFYNRFFSQQFKRSCLPDGPKVGSVAVSPRGDLRMPSDAVKALWLSELAKL